MNTTQNHRENLELLQEIMDKRRQRRILEPWAFFTWSVLIALGTILGLWVAPSLNLTQVQGLLVLWLPVIVVGILLESLAFLRQSLNLGLGPAAQRYIQFYWLFLILTSAAAVLIGGLLRLNNGDSLPYLVMPLVAVSFTVLAAMGFRGFYAVALLAVGIGGIILILEPSSILVSALAGFGTSLIMFTGGLVYRHFTRKTPRSNSRQPEPGKFDPENTDPIRLAGKDHE